MDVVYLVRWLSSVTSLKKTNDPGKGHYFHGRPGRHQADGLKEPGPGQVYALQARNPIAARRRARPGTATETRRYPAHRGIPGNEKADERTKLAVEEPNARRVVTVPEADSG